MSRISIESTREYLTWFLGPYELSELPICDRLEYESWECDKSSDDENELLCHSGLVPESSNEHGFLHTRGMTRKELIQVSTL
jgi:hypothetical protein